jgi:hypothetical protein
VEKSIPKPLKLNVWPDKLSSQPLKVNDCGLFVGVKVFVGVILGVGVFVGVCVGDIDTVGVTPVVYVVPLPPQPGQSEIVV